MVPAFLLTPWMSVNPSPFRFVRIAKWFTVGRIDAPKSVMVPGLWRKERYRKILLTRDLDEVRGMIWQDGIGLEMISSVEVQFT